MNELFRNAISYSFFNIINAATPFLLIPFLTSQLNKVGYGIIAMFTILISFLTPIVGLSVNGALTKQYFTLSEEAFRKYVGNCLFILISSSIAILGLIFIFGKFLTALTDISAYWLYMAVVITSFLFLHTIILTIWQVKEKPVKFGIFQISNSLLNLLISFALIMLMHQNWEGRINAWLISSFIMASIAIFYLWKLGYLSLSLSKQMVSHALRFSIPLIPHALGGIAIGLVGRVIVKTELGLGATGIYTVAFQLGSVLSLMMIAFNNAYVPWLFKHLKEDQLEQKRRIVGLTYIVFVAIVIVVLLGSIILHLLFGFIVGKEFAEAERYTTYLLAAFGFNGMYLMVTNYLFYAERTKLLATSTIIISLLNIPVAYYLTRNFGLTGASFAVLIAYLLLFLSTWFFSARAHKMPWAHPIFR